MHLSYKNYNEINKYKLEQEGEKVAIIALGDFYQRGKKVAENSILFIKFTASP